MYMYIQLSDCAGLMRQEFARRDPPPPACTPGGSHASEELRRSQWGGDACNDCFGSCLTARREEMKWLFSYRFL